MDELTKPPIGKIAAIARYAGKALVAAAVPILTTAVADIADVAGQWIIALIASAAGSAGVYAFKNGPKPR